MACFMETKVSNLRIIGKVARFTSFEMAAQQLNALVGVVGRPVVLSFINAHGFNLSHSHSSYREALLASDLLLRDGKGMELLFKALRKDPGFNFCGTDFIPYLLEQRPGSRVALLGTRDPWLHQAAQSLRAKGHEVVLCCDGFRSDAHYLDIVQATRPAMVILGMGNPRQEIVAQLLRQHLEYPALLINGGAIIDYMGGKVSRAPYWMRRSGLEWAYRLLLEPKRMYHRYVTGNLAFMGRVLQFWKSGAGLPGEGKVVQMFRRERA